MADLVKIKVFPLAEINFFPVIVTLKIKMSAGFLRHHIFADKGAVSPMNFKSGPRVLNRERIVKLSQDSAFETDRTHHSVLETGLGQPLPTGQRNDLFRIVVQCEVED